MNNVNRDNRVIKFIGIAIFIPPLILFLWLCLGVILQVHNAYGGQLRPFIFSFTGRWQPARDPLMIEGNGYQDIRNMRREGNRLKGVSGHARISTGVVNSTYAYIKNGYHFRKSQPEESHVLVYSEDSTNTSSRVYQNETAIPNIGDWTATALLTSASSTQIGRFSGAPRGNVVYCDESLTYIWGGDETPVTAFIVSDDSIVYSAETSKDFSEAVSNQDDTGNFIATIDTVFNNWIVGSTRPLKGIKYTVTSANTSGATITGWEWIGSAWSAKTLTDGTAGLLNSGTITFPSTITTSSPKYLEGNILYWYQFQLDTGGAKISYVTVDAPWQRVRNIWGNDEIEVASVLTGTAVSGYQDYTDEAQTDDPESFVQLKSLQSADNYLIGFAEPVQGVNIRINAGEKQSEVSKVLTVSYWAGNAWRTANHYDGTKHGTASHAKTGIVPFEPADRSIEFPKTINGVYPFYYYRMQFSGNLAANDIGPYYITGIPVQDEITAYKFSEEYQERLFLFSEVDGEKNKARYSVYNSPDIFNGNDSGNLYFGDEKELTAAAVVYNLLQDTAYYQLIVTKRNETYRVYGDGPDNWITQRMSRNIGCVAPLSMAVAEGAVIDQSETRNVAIWQSDNGIVMSDGATIIKISDDIGNYWDPNHDDFIPLANQPDSVGAYDPQLNAYKLLINNGEWIELEYSLKYNEWTRIERKSGTDNDPYRTVFQVHDTDGNVFIYGATTEGYVYNAESTATWQGTKIEQWVQTKDLLLDPEYPTLKHTVIRQFRLFMKEKDGAELSYLIDNSGNYLVQNSGDKLILDDGEDIYIEHYGRRNLTSSGDKNQLVPLAIDMSNGPYDTQAVALGPFLIHSFKLKAHITTLFDGMEILNLGLYYDTRDKILDD